MLLGALLLAAATTAGADGLLYTLSNTTHLPSTDTDWDYAKMEPGSARLFIARGNDGLTVFNVDDKKIIATVTNSNGANGPLLIPQHNRGYSAMTDGSLLSFDLKTLAALARVQLSNSGGLNSAVYDPSTTRVHAITATGKTDSTWYTLDAATGKLLGTRTFPFRKMDDPANDGKGHLFAPARYDRVILKLNGKTLDEEARWSVPCNVSKVRFQSQTNRLLAACTGENPHFLAIDVENGKVIASLPIGRGIDGFAVDEKRDRIVTSNGVDTNLTIIGQAGPDSYRLLGTIGTRANARIMTLDERSGKLYVVTADSTLRFQNGTESVEHYHPDSFVVLEYTPQ